MEQFWTIFWSALGIILTGLASWLTTKIVAWLNTKTKDKQFAKFLTQLTEIVMNSVTQITQTYVDLMKKEGTFTKENQEKAFNMCVDIVMKQLTPELISFIQENFGDVSTYLKALIETTIYNSKK